LTPTPAVQISRQGVAEHSTGATKMEARAFDG
jgi:hypothetical protein